MHRGMSSLCSLAASEKRLTCERDSLPTSLPWHHKRALCGEVLGARVSELSLVARSLERPLTMPCGKFRSCAGGHVLK